jgi:CelD/BcsL family acetyltransferase involved in cellulose biosynthesis
MPVRFEIVAAIEKFQLLQQDWDDLWKRADGSYPQTFEYCLHTLKEMALPTAARLHCVVGWKNDRLVVVWPLLKYREFLWRAVRPLTPDGSVRSDVLVEPGADARDLVEAAWHMLLKTCRSDLLSLPQVRVDSDLHLQVSRAKWMPRAVLVEIAIARTRNYGDWNAYRESLSSRSRKELDYCRRRLSKQGAVTMFIANFKDPGSIAHIDSLFAWKQQWADRTAKKGIFFSPHYRDFMIRLMMDSHSSERFLLFVLALDGQPIAVNLVAVENASVYGMQAAFDEAYAKFTPGALLLEYAVRWAFDHRRDFDFGAGGGKYKMFWAGGSSYESTDFRIPMSRWGSLAFVLSGMRRRYNAMMASLRSARQSPEAYQLRSELEP